MTDSLAIIPARKNSKGFPGKNMAQLAGKPLTAWTIESAIRSGSFKKIVVTTDCDDVARLAETYNVDLIRRPDHLCRDESPMWPVVEHALSCFEGMRTAMLLQPTSPLRTHVHIRDAFKLLNEAVVSAVISVSEIDNTFLKSFLVSDGFLKPLIDADTPFARRQDLPELVKPNGAIYLFKIRDALVAKSFLLPNTVPYRMAGSSIDIDIDLDLLEAEAMMNEIN